MKQEPRFIDEWKTRIPTNIDELIEKYRPKKIHEYKDGEKSVKVYETR
jgi:hypothetical protein